MTNITISGTNSNSNIILNSTGAAINTSPSEILIGAGTWKEYFLPASESAIGIAERNFYHLYDFKDGIAQKLLYAGDSKVGEQFGDGALLTPTEVILEFFKKQSLFDVMYPPGVYTTPATGEELQNGNFATGILDGSDNVVAPFTTSYYTDNRANPVVIKSTLDLTAQGLGVLNPEFSYSEAKCNFATDADGNEYDITYIKLTTGNDDFKAIIPEFFGDSFDNLKNRWIRFTPGNPDGLAGLFKKTSTNIFITNQMVADSPLKIPVS